MIDKNAREIFVKNMRKYMNEKGISQSDIALRLSLTASTVSDWYNGKNYPRVDVMQRLAALFNVSMRELTTEVEEEYILSDEERSLVDAFRRADRRARTDALNMLLNHPQEKGASQSAI